MNLRENSSNQNIEELANLEIKQSSLFNCSSNLLCDTLLDDQSKLR
jgi:hypothetical protein